MNSRVHMFFLDWLVRFDIVFAGSSICHDFPEGKLHLHVLLENEFWNISNNIQSCYLLKGQRQKKIQSVSACHYFLRGKLHLHTPIGALAG